ncbi:MAG: response regulator, partial [Deltaproteobacteria bacterium]|nr:response regulator [Deltaproteobacteria bacterium]
KAHPNLPVVVFSANKDLQIALDAIKMGAQTFLVKDETYDRMLQREIRFALQRQDLEQDLRQAKQEAEEMSRLKDRFVSMLAHDIRSPLTTILLTLETLYQKGKLDLTDNIRNQLLRVESGAKHLQSIVETLLDLNRLKSGKIRPRLRFVDARYLVVGLLEQLSPLAESKSITLTCEIPKDVRLHTDPGLLNQVLQNLMTNAIKFSNPGSAVTVWSPSISPPCITVRDNGIGIPPERLPKVFNLNEKASTPGTLGEKGTGFGLPFSKEVMLALGGDIQVQSTVNQGSSFTLTYPQITPRVLVVEDDKLMREVVRQFLTGLKVEIIEASDGLKALEAIETHSLPHLILSDIEMPRMDGLALLKHLKSDDRLSPIPVIVFSGDDTMETRREVLDLGALDFVRKPLVAADFLPRVRRVIA